MDNSLFRIYLIKILVRKLTEKIPPGRPRSKWADIIRRRLTNSQYNNIRLIWLRIGIIEKPL